MSRLFLMGLVVCGSLSPCWAQTSSYASTFQHTDVGVINEDGTSGEKSRALLVNETTPALAQATPVKTISVVNTTNTTKTRLYVWVDARGVKHYADSPSKAPKGAQARVVVTHKPAYVPPPVTPASDAKLDLPVPPASPANVASPPTSLPPTSLPPTSLPPLPPDF